MRRNPLKTKKSIILNSVSALALTPIERLHGRLMRAPDGHDGGGDGGGADGAGSGADAGGADGGAGAGGDAGGAGGADGGDKGGADGGAAEGAAAGDADGGDKTILGDAAAADGGGADGEGKKGDAEKGEGEGAEEGKKDGDAAFEVLGAPEAYDLKLPDDLTAAGMTFDKDAFDAVEPIFREMNLSNDAVQRVVDGYATKVIPLIQQRAEAAGDALAADMRKGWETEARADPEIGGAKFEETKALCKQNFIKFGVKPDSGFLKLLEDSGIGNHPDMLRYVANVARATGEATVDLGGGGGAPPRLADRVYGAPEPRKD